MSTHKNQKQKIAIVHDFLTYFGGAEQVLKSLHSLYPEAPIYTLLYDKKKMKRYFPKAKIRTSFLNKLPKFLRRRKKYLLPLMPTAVETFDLRAFDIVISSSSSFAKGIITKPKTAHICYCHTPTRFLWDWHLNYLKENKIQGIKKVLILPILHYMRMWDKAASERVDYFIANSKNTAKRIEKFYGMKNEVIYPPCDTVKGLHFDDNFMETKLQDFAHAIPQPFETMEPLKEYFLIVSRLSPYKKIDIAVEAFNKLDLPLIIIGEGEDRKRLENMAEKNIKFLGFQSAEKLVEYYQNCQAFIFPGEDDFGITAIEAMSFGKPVLAFRKGGLKETVIEGETGEFFDDAIPEILADGVRRLKNNYKKYDSVKIKNQANKFSRKNFENSMKKFIEKVGCHPR
ncbi:MAG: glycosyltransferase [Candidatus Pacebacteria bacterium]|nr:glycosyltransferase [Candidatus Paceibacterota bacterium]